MNKPCEYCGYDLPFGIDKKTGQTRSRHFDPCKGRLSEKLQESVLEAKDEPAAGVSGYFEGQCVVLSINTNRISNSGTSRYTTPPKRTWVGLTDEEKQNLWNREIHMELLKDIEAKLKEKNT